MFERILDSIFDSVLITDRTGTIMEVNEACCRTLGHEREALLGMDVFSILSKGEASAILGLAHEKKKRGLRLSLRAADGTMVLVKANVQHMTHKGEEAILCVARDVTERKAMEEALKESEESYRNVLALSPDSIAIVRREDARYLQVNDAFCRQIGYTAEEIIGRTSADLDLYADPGDRRRLFGILAREGRVDGIEIRYRAKEGTILDELLSARSIRFRGEDCFLIVATVITSLKKAEQALRKSEERYRTILEGIEAGYYELDLSGRFTFFNDAMCRIIGFFKEEMMGMDYREYTSPEGAERSFGTFKEVYRTRKPAYVSDYELISKDGRKLALEQSILLMENDKGEPVGFRGITHDVTERRAMEEALRESEEKYRTILEGMEEGYYEVDLSGRFTFFNSALCRMGGVPAEELMGMSNLEYAAPEAAKMIYQTFNEVYRTGKPAEIVDHEIIKRDGSRSAHELSVSLMRDKKGTPIGFRGVVRDVTLRKQAEEEIQTHREHLALINQILRHDLTNDLIVAQSGLNLYKISHEEELLEETEGRVKKSLDLIGRMRELEAFISSHKDLKAYKIRDVISEIAGNYPFINVTVKGKAQVMADDSLFSVIDNITRNAVIHGKTDRIEVTIGRREGMCEVRIADGGSGVPDEIKEAIFEEGFMHGDTGHTGLGLHIVKKAMEKYGGYVYVEDNEPRGAVFVLTFKAI